MICRLVALVFGISTLCPTFSHANVPQDQTRPIIYVKHLEPPLRYPQLARQTLIQGTVIVRVSIGADGNVIAAKSLNHDEDSRASGHPLLREETEKLIKKWTFGCANCPSEGPYETTIKFTYQLQGEGILYDDSRVSMDLPDEVTITASPPQCDHCPRKKKTK